MMTRELKSYVSHFHCTIQPVCMQTFYHVPRQVFCDEHPDCDFCAGGRRTLDGRPQTLDITYLPHLFQAVTLVVDDAHFRPARTLSTVFRKVSNPLPFGR